MQRHVIQNNQPWGLGLNEKLMPQYFKEAGYRTHLVGKWHLGFFKQEYTPLFRGFDEHVGYFGSQIGYYDYSTVAFMSSVGFDFRRNLTSDPSVKGTYATDLFSKETQRIIANHNVEDPLFLMVNHLAVHSTHGRQQLQAPAAEIVKFEYIKDTDRRTLAGNPQIIIFFCADFLNLFFFI
jgi:arylsulfatase B